MVFDLSHPFAARVPGDGLALSEIVDPARFGSIVPLHEAVYRESDSAEWLASTLANEKRAAPSALRMFAVHAGELLVSAGWLRLPTACAFASLWGGATHPEWRECGCYTGLVAARLDVARNAGLRYVTVDCSAASRPILERRGFMTLATIGSWIGSP